jgi:two-component system invasion response regulator UvrY
MQAVITHPSSEWSADRAAIKVLLADDHPLIIAGIRRTIDDLEDIEVVGEAHSGGELLQLVERRGPDTVLMDLNMPSAPGLSGIELIGHLRREHPELKLVVLSACDDRPTIDAALHAGASAYVLKSAQTVDIPSVIRQASSGAVFRRPRRCPL